MAKRTGSYIGVALITVSVLGIAGAIILQKRNQTKILKGLDEAFNKGGTQRDFTSKGAKITISEVDARNLARTISAEMSSKFNVDEGKILNLLESQLKQQEDFSLLQKQYQLVAKADLDKVLKAQFNAQENSRYQQFKEQLK